MYICMHVHVFIYIYTHIHSYMHVVVSSIKYATTAVYLGQEASRTLRQEAVELEGREGWRASQVACARMDLRSLLRDVFTPGFIQGLRVTSGSYPGCILHPNKGSTRVSELRAFGSRT